MTKTELQVYKDKGLPVWYLEPQSQQFMRGYVKSFHDAFLVPYATITMLSSQGRPIGTCGVKLEKLFPSKEALQAAVEAEDQAKVVAIKESIKMKDDLIRFMYDHVVACAEEYTDWVARRAVRELALERYGIDLEVPKEE